MEYLWVRETETYLETRGTLEKAIPHYNECRPHSSLGYQTPRAFYAQKMKEAGALWEQKPKGTRVPPPKPPTTRVCTFKGYTSWRSRISQGYVSC